MQPHPVFIYYLWNSYGTGDDWNGDNPKPYFMDGHGDVLAGLHRFQSYGSNIPVAFKMIICYDDSTWSIPSSYDASQMFQDGKEYVGDQLNSLDDEWDDQPSGVSVYNCGFDVLLMAAGRDTNGIHGQAESNRAIVFMAGSKTDPEDWKVNIDGVTQHEIAHIFGCKDVEQGHTMTQCIMCYRRRRYYQFEECSYWWCYQVDYWCTHSGSDHCQYQFDNNWDMFYTCAPY
jgi:hypothetical protein